MFSITVIILLIWAIGATALSVFFARKCMEYYDLFENLQKEIRDILGKLNIVYNNVHKKSQYDIFLDEPVVKDLMEDIKVTFNLIIIIANTLTQYFKDEDENTNDDDGNADQIAR
jgi:hypothetical protein